MAQRAEQLKQELVDEVLQQVREKLPPERSAGVERFTRSFYAHVPPGDLLEDSPEQLYGAVLALLQFGAQRPPGTAKVRVYNPRVERHGWQSSQTVVELVNDDMPFLVDSVTAELQRQGVSVRLVIHPVVRMLRDSQGNLLEAVSEDPQARPESFMHVEIDQRTDERTLESLRTGLETVLADVRAAVEDWQAMRHQALALVVDVQRNPGHMPESEVSEAADLLQWLVGDHFTFLGYREYRFTGEVGSSDLVPLPTGGLGILRDPEYRVFGSLRSYQTLPPEARAFLRQATPVLITKANRQATVHRPVRLDAIFIKAYDANGQVTGERMFVGLFTSVAYASSPRDIPFLRRKVTRTLARAGFDPRGHSGKALVNILETFPRDELFQISEDELFDMALGILHLQERQRVALFVRRDPFERFISCLVYVPRDRYGSELRLKVQGLLEQAYQAQVAAYYLSLTESVYARVHYILHTEPGTIPAVDVAALEARVVEAARGWPERLSAALVESHGEERGLQLAQRYAQALPTSYRERFTTDVAVFDIGKVEESATTGSLTLNLYRPLESPASELRLKLYNPGRPMHLSSALPVLENMGVEVVSEIPYEVRLQGAPGAVWIHDFILRLRNGAAVELESVKQPFEEAFTRVCRGDMEDDGLNRLVLGAGLDWREVVVLRGYTRYLRQARFPYGHETIEDTLAAHPRITALLIRLFHARNDPALGGRHEHAQELATQVEQALEHVSNLDEDRIIRRFLNLVRSTLRTNHYQRGADGAPKPYLSFKLDSQSIEELPLPRPWVEIFVYSPRVEAVHLRGGRVARGGIRWSDRREDFRTEILGLMKAQMVKNTVIVPVGSKGGFVVKHLPPAEAGREAQMAEVVECYKTLMRGLLDITDNLVAGQVVPPKDVVRNDGDDPYLVVAADKGTATFSDIANSVSLEYGFWLGDAFASGGSAGYDHKKMGITARGGWESVKRHFRELGKDIQKEDFTVVGVGDMSGDVFGNGMLLSRHIRLLAAFDHRHIFLDPDPDPERSWHERKRLFELPRSSWADYNPELLSPGGGVFDRKAKSIKLSEEVRRRFNLQATSLTPAELMQALLRAEVDLLWFGGIGTFVKSSQESHTDVGDKANDAQRVDASELRAKVIAEGANLGMTQRGRIEAALHGVRLNTDAIDNSAGVDTSDHEVNIKILLGDVVSRQDMTLKQRNKLLAEMTEEVAALVLRDNYLQTQALSVQEAQGAELLEQQGRLIRALEKAGRLNRRLEYLPNEEELRRRAQLNQGLTRPELAILLAYAKLTLYDVLLESDLPDEPRMVEDLHRYFPQPLQREHAESIGRHKLQREIIATCVTNEMVNRLGPTFLHELRDKTGATWQDMARAYVIVREAYGLRELWGRIEGLDNQVPAATQVEMLVEVVRLLERVMGWLLVYGRRPLDMAAEGYPRGVRALVEALQGVLCEEDRAELEARAKGLAGRGVPEDLAWHVAALPLLAWAPDVVRTAWSREREVAEVARVYGLAGRHFGLVWLRERARAMSVSNSWQRQAVGAIVDELYALQGELTARVVEQGSPLRADSLESTRVLLEQWSGERQVAVERVKQLLAELQAVPSVDLAMLAVASRQLRRLVAG